MQAIHSVGMLNICQDKDEWITMTRREKKIEKKNFKELQNVILNEEFTDSKQKATKKYDICSVHLKSFTSFTAFPIVLTSSETTSQVANQSYQTLHRMRQEIADRNISRENIIVYALCILMMPFHK